MSEEVCPFPKRAEVAKVAPYVGVVVKVAVTEVDRLRQVLSRIHFQGKVEH